MPRLKQIEQKPDPQQVTEFLLLLPPKLDGRLVIATVAAACVSNSGNFSAMARALNKERRWVIKQMRRVKKYLANHILAELRPYDPEAERG